MLCTRLVLNTALHYSCLLLLAVILQLLEHAAPLEEDLEFLRIAEKNLVKLGTINPAEPRVPIQKSAVLAVDRKQ
jgi:hypothetical protein